MDVNVKLLPVSPRLLTSLPATVALTLMLCWSELVAGEAAGPVKGSLVDLLVDLMAGTPMGSWETHQKSWVLV